ncbi:pyridine nucleotide-disulfide oxidoreductase [Desulfosarcina alkanivorans]|uniref:Pyridine nucleotide-disulfide oxidoreductase n=1 Tax=Desulfosarcina alkanivorans TaxID=571177 RepID=A0A5K7Z7G7_9BACT|nr:NAD(P)/FAD-dependent oxidoreductase [Desulfosarcina alkanivorans]BBO72457.1 pyridine nucleotide-disulfide oxidoreductase [Desulfosarcina alkanivorans]
MSAYDVVVIGSGTAGQTAAYELKSRGLTVAVAEKSNTPGGTCALAGCQAKKWFYEAAETAAKSNHLKGRGIVSPPQVSWADVLRGKNKFTTTVPGNTLTGFKKAGIDVISGVARFLDEKTLDIGGRKVSARFFVVASGAHPMPLPIEGIENAITSDGFLELPSLPGRFVFIGGGFISFEFAHFVARLGDGPSRQTTILEAAPRALGPFDAEMVSLLVAASKTEGIDVHTGVRISSVEKDGNAFRVVTGDGVSYAADVVVNSAGRLPDVNDLDLDRAGIDFSRRGISVNARMQTTQPNIYAVGDCASTVQLARVADYEAMVAVNAILGEKGGGGWPEMDYSAVPAILFTYPQYGMVGYTEDALKHEGIPYTKSFGKNLSWPTYRRIGMSDAAYKILAGTDGAFLGAHILSDNAAGIINTIRLAMLNRIPAETLYRQSMMSPYPSRESDMLYMLKPLSQEK